MENNKKTTITIEIQLKLPFDNEIVDNAKFKICNLNSFAKRKNEEGDKATRVKIYKELAIAAKELPW